MTSAVMCMERAAPKTPPSATKENRATRDGAAFFERLEEVIGSTTLVDIKGGEKEPVLDGAKPGEEDAGDKEAPDLSQMAAMIFCPCLAPQEEADVGRVHMGDGARTEPGPGSLTDTLPLYIKSEGEGGAVKREDAIFHEVKEEADVPRPDSIQMEEPEPTVPYKARPDRAAISEKAEPAITLRSDTTAKKDTPAPFDMVEEGETSIKGSVESKEKIEFSAKPPSNDGTEALPKTPETKGREGQKEMAEPRQLPFSADLTRAGAAQEAATDNIKPAATAPPVHEQISARMGEALLGNTKEGDFVMKLKPEGLGEVEVSLRYDGERLSVEITAKSEGTMKLLEGQSAELKAALVARSLEVDRLTIIHSASQGGPALSDSLLNGGGTDRWGSGGKESPQPGREQGSLPPDEGKNKETLRPGPYFGRLNYRI